MDKIQVPLSLGEFAALKVVSKGQGQTTITKTAQNRLIELGLIRQVLGALQVTQEGLLRLAKGQ